jgi:HEAT repeat protein
MAPGKKNIRDELQAADESVLLAELARTGSDRKRKIAAELGRRGATGAVEPLRLLLRSNDPDLRASAAEALGRIDGPSTHPGALVVSLNCRTAFGWSSETKYAPRSGAIATELRYAGKLA